MRNLKKIIVVASLTWLAFTANAQQNKQRNTITAQALCEAFTKDKTQAEKEYGNRTMRITGVAVYIGPDIYALPSVELSEKKDGHSRALCVLPMSDYLKLRRVSKGDKVVMEGEVRSIYDKEQTVVVKNCKIVEVNKK